MIETLIGTMLVEMCVSAVLLGLIPAIIARNKGRSFIVWWIYGALLFIVALPHALIIRQEENEEFKKCPYCAELIKREAKVCKHCGRTLPLNGQILPLTEHPQADGTIANEEKVPSVIPATSTSAVFEEPADKRELNPLTEGSPQQENPQRGKLLVLFILLIIFFGMILVIGRDQFSSQSLSSETPSLSAQELAAQQREAERKREEAQRARTERKVRLEAELNELRKFVRSHTDEIEGVKWIHDKTTPKQLGRNNFYIYLGQRSGYTWPRLVMGFQRDGWVFMERIIINVDGESHTITFPFYERNSEVLYGAIEEHVDFPAKEHERIIKKIGRGKKVMVRYRGDRYQHDVQLSKNQIAAVRRMYRMYEVYKALEEYR